MPCLQERDRREREEFIRKNRKDVNPYEGLSDPLEILKVKHRPRKPDPLVCLSPCPRKTEALYAELDIKRTAALVQHAAELVSCGEAEQAEDIARCLTAFTEADISPLLHAFVSAEHFASGFIFLRATPDICELLMKRLARVPEDEEHRLIRDKLLSALAWIGDARVVDLFGRWRVSPPSWAKTLFVPPERYAENAGWQLAGDLRRHELYHKVCYPLLHSDAEDSTSLSVAMTVRQDRCPWCNHQLLNLFDLNGSLDQLAFLGCSSVRITIPFCECCSRFGVLFGKLGEHGSAWSDYNKKPTRLPGNIAAWEGIPHRKLSLAGTSRSPQCPISRPKRGLAPCSCLSAKGEREPGHKKAGAAGAVPAWGNNGGTAGAARGGRDQA